LLANTGVKMIKEIHLSNFYSIKEEVVLDLKAGNIKTQKSQELSHNIFDFEDTKILKSVALYGANASGKSNIIKAIRFCASMIFHSHNHNENVVFNFKPFKFQGFAKKPSTFKITFAIKEIEYEYSFSLNQTEIITEELYYFPNGRRAKVFTRDERLGVEKNKIYSFSTAIKKPLDVAENTSKKTLYISRASQMDREIAKEIFRFFNESFILGYIGFNNLDIEKLFNENKYQVIKALQIADSDIVDIQIKNELKPVKNLNADFLAGTASIKDDIKPQLIITSYHKSNPKIGFDFATEESAGTQALFAFILTILDIVKNNKILLVDEIEMSLHTKIVEYIIELFNASKSAQLIYTTHNTNLLNLSKLRKDQIYFVNKKEDGTTDLYSLYDYKDFRDTMDVEKAYLQGRFDAIPYINDSFENLMELLNESK
jgi:AAA15 family ATPase/GTPase